MNKRFIVAILTCAMLVAGYAPTVLAAEPQAINLPQPQLDGGKSLMQALKERKTTREFADREIPLQTISNLLWAAYGINRPDGGRRTAPSAWNRQSIDVYVALAKGLYRYEAQANSLVPVLGEDIRALTGKQSFVKDAPVNLIYVADYSRIGDRPEAEKDFVSAADTGFVAENVYLYCASEGLGTVIRAAIDREKLAEAMKLKPEQKITLSQTVGYPK
jgi:SagB-type dehydrogenase family enzyme